MIEVFTGGAFETHGYYLRESEILLDAPEGMAQWLSQGKRRVKWLMLTHGHVDHVWDAARIQREHECSVAYHPHTDPMVTDSDFFVRLGFPWRVEAVRRDVYQEAVAGAQFGGEVFDVLEVPGHCPGSLCFFWKRAEVLFGGDVLFAGGVGRWDLPGGDRELLLGGIRKKLFPLGAHVRVLPGHGPETTIGAERLHNPYLS